MFLKPLQEKSLSFNHTIYVFPKRDGASFRVYRLKGDAPALTSRELDLLAKKLFCDYVSESFIIDERPKLPRACIVWFKKGVFDPEGDMALYAAKKLGLAGNIGAIHYGRGLSLGKDESPTHYPLVEFIEWV